MLTMCNTGEAAFGRDDAGDVPHRQSADERAQPNGRRDGREEHAREEDHRVGAGERHPQSNICQRAMPSACYRPSCAASAPPLVETDSLSRATAHTAHMHARFGCRRPTNVPQVATWCSMLQQQYAQVENEELQEAVGESASEVKRLLAVRYFRILTCAADGPKHRRCLSALARQSNPIQSNPIQSDPIQAMHRATGGSVGMPMLRGAPRIAPIKDTAAAHAAYRRQTKAVGGKSCLPRGAYPY